MKIEQESKFAAVDGRLVNRATGVPIPDDEPVFVLRAKDRRALAALRAYRDCGLTEAHAQAVSAQIRQFERFATEHPERMTEPDTAESCICRPQIP
jgi:hypothetical protein